MMIMTDCKIQKLLTCINEYFNESKMSFIKWVGGKSKLLKEITPCIFKKEFNVYLEPFLGSGSVLIELLQQKPNVICKANDINTELITVFNVIKSNPDELIFGLNQLYNNIDEKNYYELREVYNKVIRTKDAEYVAECLCVEYKLIDMDSEMPEEMYYSLLVAILFIYLNKTCFRGLYRVNKKGEMNVPYGYYKKPKLVDAEEIKHRHKLFQRVEFSNKDYKEFIKDNITNDSLIYFDPPYYGTFNDYDSNKFSHDEFFETINELKNKCKLVISNSKQFVDNYEPDGFDIKLIDVQDKINSKSPNSKRQEVILYNNL